MQAFHENHKNEDTRLKQSDNVNNISSFSLSHMHTNQLKLIYQSNRRVFAKLDRFQISDIKEKRFGVELRMVEIDSIECQE